MFSSELWVFTYKGLSENTAPQTGNRRQTTFITFSLSPEQKHGRTTHNNLTTVWKKWPKPWDPFGVNSPIHTKRQPLVLHSSLLCKVRQMKQTLGDNLRVNRAWLRSRVEQQRGVPGTTWFMFVRHKLRRFLSQMCEITSRSGRRIMSLSLYLVTRSIIRPFVDNKHPQTPASGSCTQ